MKSSTAYVLVALLSAAQVQATCVPGTRETISPDYIVEYKCDWLRVGKTHSGVNSPKECAALARDAGATASTYHPPSKKCVVGREGGTEKANAGTYYMVKVEEDEEDPFKEDEVEEEDPFAMTCDEEKDACLERETALKAELASSKEALAASKAESDRIRADSALLKDFQQSSCPGQHTKYGTVAGTKYRFWCGRYHDPAGQRETHAIGTMEACVKLCTSKAWCTMVLHGVHQPECQLYDRKVNIGVTPPHYGSGYWNSAVNGRG
ncbi:hypothetical protein Focb16_v010952 [Fusarium oxysporum f. sp. cubense]|uniref:Apple domain-containing protein n=1 Tax=Fusarium oxysporum f. sp. cubense TaxID=61366 RepID=A0A559L2S2_FUSOC|nr:hypothetical protein Focb16_v010952 [Fusarium oxysporum f. sp. cubense]